MTDSVADRKFTLSKAPATNLENMYPIKSSDT
jgi:hypothetical protein